MKTSQIILPIIALFAYTNILIAQVGIGTITPLATLHVEGDLIVKTTNTSTPTKLSGVDADGFMGAVILGANLTLSGGVLSASGGSSDHYVGETYLGGMVFYVWDDGAHGLIVNDSNLGTDAKWCLNNSDISGASSVNNGSANTMAIVADQGSGDYAAKLCYDLTDGGVSAGTWYLPSLWELNLLYNSAYVITSNYGSINGVLNDNTDEVRYWSSTQKDNDEAWVQKIMEGRAEKKKKTDANAAKYKTRAIRSF